MHAVALTPRSDRGGEVDLDGVVAMLARDLGRSHAELRQRIALAGDDPVVLGVQRDAEIAERTARSSCERGVMAVAVSVPEPVPGLVVARSFTLHDDALHVVDRERRTAVVRFDDVHAVVLARRFEAPTPRREPTPTGIARRVSRPLHPVLEQPSIHTPPAGHEGLVYLFADGGAAALREHELLYHSLGPALQPSRGANFRVLVERLRERCARATCDERLLRSAVQAHVLGPMIAIDGHLALAAALVGSAVRRAAGDPYR